MVEITNELMYEVLRSIQRVLSDVKNGVSEIKLELNAIRGHMISMQQDVHNIYGVLARHEIRLEQIERRFELSEPVPS